MSSSVKRTRLAAPLLAATALAAAGCQAGYVFRQAWGQLTFDADEIAIASPELPGLVGDDAARKLEWVPRILEFARAELGLDPGDSYSTYVDTREKPVSYVVTAAHPLALVPFQWHFPFAGTVPYKGHFSESAARAEAKRLRQQGYETLVFPVMAFSTLGWFQDPVVSSMLAGSIADLVDVIIHETTHRTVYYPGLTSFNECLATFIAREGTVRFLSSHQELRPLLDEYLRDHRAAAEREEVLLRLRDDLDALYRHPADEATVRRRKAELFSAADAALSALSGERGGQRLHASNAHVLSVARYHDLERPLAAAQARLGGHPRQLIAFLEDIGTDVDPLASILELAHAGPVAIE